MSKLMRQHYVPRLYLKNFSVSKNNTCYVFVKQKYGKRIFETNIENIAVEKNFYTVEKLKDKNTWEKFYANTVEPQFNSQLNKIILKCSNMLLVDGVKIINDQDKQELALDLAIQIMRGKIVRNKEIELYNKLSPGILDSIEYKKFKQTREYCEKLLKNKDTFKEVVYRLTMNSDLIKKLTNVLYNKGWVLFQTVDNAEFITSDSPLMVINGNRLDATPFKNGLALDDTVISFPISPDLLLMLYSKNKFFGYFNNNDGCRFWIDKEINFVHTINYLQYEQCNKFVIARREESLHSLSIK